MPQMQDSAFVLEQEPLGAWRAALGSIELKETKTAPILSGWEPGDSLAESWGFEPQIPLWGILA